jgi:hypothetical protein
MPGQRRNTRFGTVQVARATFAPSGASSSRLCRIDLASGDARSLGKIDGSRTLTGLAIARRVFPGRDRIDDGAAAEDAS